MLYIVLIVISLVSDRDVSEKSWIWKERCSVIEGTGFKLTFVMLVYCNCLFSRMTVIVAVDMLPELAM